MSELNPYEKESNLVLNADFYSVEILNQEAISPNDLPVLFEISVRDFLQLEFCKQGDLSSLKNYSLTSDGFENDIPDYYVMMIPEEVKSFLKRKLYDNEKNSV